MKQSELRMWLDNELANWKGVIGYAEVFAICWRLIGELQKKEKKS